MIESVKAAVKRYNMFSSEKTVTVALSGGADSVALLFALLELRNEFGLTLSAAHLNHCLRGEESDGDEQFVRNLCESLGVKLYCERADVSSVAESNGESIELAARRVRYEFLERVSDGLVATAHTADDNIETVLHNISRGSGLSGVCGIPPVRGKIIRPLIFVTRAEVEEYCAENGLSFRTDSSNNSDDYTRNRIRHGAVPVLKSVNSSAVKNAALMSERMRIDADFLEVETRKSYNGCCSCGGLVVEKLLQLHPAIKTRCIALLCKNTLGLSLEHTHIELILEMLKEDKKRQSVLKNCYAEVSCGVLRFCQPVKGTEAFSFPIDSFPFSQKGLIVREETAENFKNVATVNNLLFKNSLDCDKICGKLIFRSRLPGDSIKLNGRGVTKTFKKLFNEHNIPVGERDRVVVLSDDKGVVWLSGFGVDERAAVSDKTKNVLVIEGDKNER